MMQSRIIDENINIIDNDSLNQQAQQALGQNQSDQSEYTATGMRLRIIDDDSLNQQAQKALGQNRRRSPFSRYNLVHSRIPLPRARDLHIRVPQNPRSLSQQEMVMIPVSPGENEGENRNVGEGDGGDVVWEGVDDTTREYWGSRYVLNRTCQVE